MHVATDYSTVSVFLSDRTFHIQHLVSRPLIRLHPAPPQVLPSDKIKVSWMYLLARLLLTELQDRMRVWYWQFHSQRLIQNTTERRSDAAKTLFCTV